MGSCAAPSAKGDDKFITTDYLQQCLCVNRLLYVAIKPVLIT
ncbi:putative transposase [Escherichia coli 2-156-04_S4_C2]|nr:putative transposase [Escherichia coli 2-156-04_S4_C2]